MARPRRPNHSRLVWTPSRRGGGWPGAVALAALWCLAAAPGCTTSNDKANAGFAGPDRRPGLRAGGLQDLEAFAQAIDDGRVPTSQEYMTAGWQNEQVASLPDAGASTVYTIHSLAAVGRGRATGDALTALVQIGANARGLLARAADGSPTVDVGGLALVLAVDVSGSMARSSKMAMVRQGLHALVEALPSGVIFGLVSFNGESFATWHPRVYQRSDHLKALHTRIDGMEAAGGTNLHEGLRRGLLQASEISADLKHRHLLLLTDGRPTSGVIDTDAILGLLAQSWPHQVQVSTMGIGDDFDAELLEKIAAAGGGRVWFSAAPKTAARVLPEVLATLTTPSVANLTLEIEPGTLWQLVDMPGFATETSGSRVKVVGPTPRVSAALLASRLVDAQKATAAAQAARKAAVNARKAADADPTDKPKGYTAQLAEEAAVEAEQAQEQAWANVLPSAAGPMPSLLGTLDPGVVLARLRLRDGLTLDPQQLKDAAIATVRWSYDLPDTSVRESGTSEARIAFLSEASDGSFEALSTCLSRATMANYQAGEAAREAIALWDEARALELQPAPAATVLTALRAEAWAAVVAALVVMDDHEAALDAQLNAVTPTCDANAADAVKAHLARCRCLLAELREAMRPVVAPETAADRPSGC